MSSGRTSPRSGRAGPGPKALASTTLARPSHSLESGQTNPAARQSSPRASRTGASGGIRTTEGSLLLACALVLLGFTTACGPEDLPPGIIPGAVVSFDRSTSTTGTAATSSSFAITSFTPTTPAAETVLTVNGRGFGTDPTFLGIELPAAANTVRTIDSTNPELIPVSFVFNVLTATGTALTANLPQDVISGPFSVGKRATAATTAAGPVQTVAFLAETNQLTLNITPRIASLNSPILAGTPVNLTVTGLSPRLSDNVVRFRTAAGVEVGTATASSITFNPTLRSSLTVTIPGTITATVASFVLQVRTLSSAAFP